MQWVGPDMIYLFILLDSSSVLTLWYLLGSLLVSLALGYLSGCRKWRFDTHVEHSHTTHDEHIHLILLMLLFLRKT
jgi:hypothetical protein